MIPHLKSVKVPTLNVAGWWDQEDFYGPLAIYDALEQHDTQRQNYPRRRAVAARRMDAAAPANRSAPFRSAATTAEYFREQVQAPFFAYYLKDRARGLPAGASTFEVGRKRWRRWDQWPPTSSG